METKKDKEGEWLEFFKKGLNIDSEKKGGFIMERLIVSFSSVTWVMLFYILGYCIKLTMTLQVAFLKVIDIDGLRFFTAFLVSLGLATGLLLVSIHKHEEKWLPKLFGLMDVITLIMVFSSGADADTFNVLGFNFSFYIPSFKEFFFSFLMAFIGYQLVGVFVKLLNEKKERLKIGLSDLLRLISETEERLSDLKQGQSEEERKLNEVLTNLKQDISEEERIINERIAEKEQELQGYIKRTCLNCSAVFGSVNGLNAHKGKCKGNS